VSTASRSAASIGAAALCAAASVAFAFPEGPPWEAAAGEGCAECHFDAPPTDASAAVSIIGLPTAMTPGARYPLTVRLEHDDLENAGFLLSAWQGPDGVGGEEAGLFEAVDGNVETLGGRARSTEDGSRPASPGVAEWSVVWEAPASVDGPIVFDVWANAGNADKSPFGDSTHHRVFELENAELEKSAAGTESGKVDGGGTRDSR
jgi:hypothetical protein